jgi:hypothetical protein
MDAYGCGGGRIVTIEFEVPEVREQTRSERFKPFKQFEPFFLQL